MTAQDIQDIRYATYSMCRFGLRSIISTMLVGVASSFLLIADADAASLKQTALVNDDVVRLGDIFNDAEQADKVIGGAPEPGESITLGAVVLNRLAKSHAVEWAPESSFDQITVKREAHIIGKPQMEETLKSALAEKGLDGDFSLTLSSATGDIVIPGNIAPTVEVSSINYTEGRDVFTATLSSPSAENPVKTATVSGLINRMVQVPSLTTTTRQGDVISASDIAWIDVPVRSVSKDTVLDADELIGKTPIRVIASDKPVRIKDVMSPRLVSRGDDITILYEVGGMTLSAKGKSHQNGSEGELIRVTNLSSAKSMSAEITGDRIVKVQ